MALRLPVQATVDRSARLDIYLVPGGTPVTDSKGNVIAILKNPVGGPYGSLPGDPAWFPDTVNTRLAVCHILSGYAAARCPGGMGAF